MTSLNKKKLLVLLEKYIVLLISLNKIIECNDYIMTKKLPFNKDTFIIRTKELNESYINKYIDYDYIENIYNNNESENDENEQSNNSFKTFEDNIEDNAEENTDKNLIKHYNFVKFDKDKFNLYNNKDGICFKMPLFIEQNKKELKNLTNPEINPLKNNNYLLNVPLIDDRLDYNNNIPKLILFNAEINIKHYMLIRDEIFFSYYYDEETKKVLNNVYKDYVVCDILIDNKYINVMYLYSFALKYNISFNIYYEKTSFVVKTINRKGKFKFHLISKKIESEDNECILYETYIEYPVPKHGFEGLHNSLEKFISDKIKQKKFN